MKFAHIADCHLGSWRDSRLKKLNEKAFESVIQKIIEEKVDFTIIAGDLFNNAIPHIETLKFAVKSLQKLKKNNIPVYAIPGSHDFSSTGKSMLEVLEEAQLLTNVYKGTITNKKLQLQFTTDPKTNLKLTGILGRRGTLEREQYESLDIDAFNKETGDKIFLFHTSITQLKTPKLEKMESNDVAMLPQGCIYYAGGHVHIVNAINLPGYDCVSYPGPTFPNNFGELADLKKGGFNIVNVESTPSGPKATPTWIPVEPIQVEYIAIHIDKLTTEDTVTFIEKKVKDRIVKEKLVLLRVWGKLSQGTPIDIDFKSIIDNVYHLGAKIVLRNTGGLLGATSAEDANFEHKSIAEIEQEIISSMSTTYPLESKTPDITSAIAQQLVQALNQTKKSDERVHEFEERIRDEVEQILEVTPNQELESEEQLEKKPVDKNSEETAKTVESEPVKKVAQTTLN